MEQNKSQNAEEQQTQAAGWDKTTSWHGWTAWGEWFTQHTQTVFDGLLVLVTSVYAVFALLQWCALNSTLRETKRLVAVANIQANAAQAANNLTRAAQEQTQEIMANTERPWVGVYEASVVNYALNKIPEIRLDISNSGKTPALNVNIKLSAARIKLAESLVELPVETQGIIFPNQTVQVSYTAPGPVDNQQIQNLESGQSSIVYKTIIIYTDRFRREHSTTVCGIIKGAPSPNNITKFSFLTPNDLTKFSFCPGDSAD